MVSGDNDAKQGQHRIGKQCNSLPSLFGNWPQCKHAPCRPANVQRRHRCILIRYFCCRTAIEMQWATIHFNRVCKSKVLRTVVVAHLMRNTCSSKSDVVFGARCIKQSGWHERKQNKTNDCQSSHCCKRVAPLTKNIWSASKQQHKHTERHKEMRSAVIRIHELDQPNMRQEEILN